MFADLPAPLLLSLGYRLDATNADHLPYLKRLQEAHADDFWANSRLAEIFRAIKFPAEAIRYDQAALAIKTEVGVVHNNLGMALGQLGRFQDAVDPYREALRLDPTAIHFHHNMATTLPAVGRVADRRRPPGPRPGAPSGAGDGPAAIRPGERGTQGVRRRNPELRMVRSPARRPRGLERPHPPPRGRGHAPPPAPTGPTIGLEWPARIRRSRLAMVGGPD